MLKKMFGSKGKDAAQDAARTQVMELLDMALAQRTKFHLVFDNEVTSVHNLSCTLLSFNSGQIKLELTSLKQAGKRWAGEALTCYFKVVEKTPKVREIFHSFRSVVEEAGQSEHETVLLTIRTPAVVGQDQRRKSLRIAPDMSSFVSLYCWPFSASGAVDVCSPKLTLADFKTPSVRLANISAGGLKLVVKNAKLREVAGDFQKGSRLVIQAKVEGIPGTTMDECWLIAKAVMIYEDFVTKDVHIGMEFIGVGKADPETQKIAWKKVADNVIEDLATWTHHWHLDLYRERGV
ncbi:MAG: hypothetical protein HQK81_09820 [Desulfovibrionaceae bacterium]|nr:hypothetical protein [Desulfovibrionaceae bacterium]MBF0514336.1 hypothetical protein [Desulfovibrionaceae bacterium]